MKKEISRIFGKILMIFAISIIFLNGNVFAQEEDNSNVLNNDTNIEEKDETIIEVASGKDPNDIVLSKDNTKEQNEVNNVIELSKQDEELVTIPTENEIVENTYNDSDENLLSNSLEEDNKEETLEVDNKEDMLKVDNNEGSENEINNNEIITPEISSNEILLLENESAEENITSNEVQSYKVTFTHSGYKLSIPGGSTILLSNLNSKLGIDISLSDVYEVLTSNNGILNISSVTDSNDYAIKSLKSFDTEEELIIYTKSGEEYIIKVTDPVNDIPDHEKILHDNHDGTYTLELTVTGDADPVEEPQPINVLLVYDVSSSMIKYWIDGTDNKGNVGFKGTNKLDEDYTEENISDNYTGYFPLYKKVGNSYELLGADEAYTDQLYRRGNRNDSYVEYNGDRYTTTRADAAEKVIHGFVKDLYKINSSTNISLIGFSNRNDTSTIVDWTITSTDVTSALSDAGTRRSFKRTYTSGTNYEQALKEALSQLDNLDDTTNSHYKELYRDAQTFIIFITDGEPSQSGNSGINGGSNSMGHYVNARDEVRQVAEYVTYVPSDSEDDPQSNTTFYGIYAYGREYDYLDDLVYDAYHETPRTNITGDTDYTGVDNYYFKATDTAALQEAMKNIFNQISDWLGIANATINDGTTSNVIAESDISHLLDVDINSFKYYKGNSEWTTAPEAVLNENGEVVWNLGEEVLENGVTYRVTFDVWPSQVTLDLIADLKNGTILYDYNDDDIIFDSTTKKYYLKDEEGNRTNQEVIDPALKPYLVKKGNGYTLYTNTVATLSFTDTREGWNGTNSDEYDTPDPVSTQATEMLAITKKWSNELDEREASPVTIKILKDNDEWFKINLNSGNQFKGGANISVGIMTIDANGNVNIRTSGHDYSFGELGNDVYNWELKTDIVHPMLINGTLTILVRYGTTTPTSGTYYKIGDYYYVVGELSDGVAELNASNERRSWIDITKTVTYGEDATHFDDQLFYFDINVKDKEGKDIWFAVKETASTLASYIYEKDGLEVEGATKEIKELTPSELLPAESINYNENTGMITYTYDGEQYTVLYAGKEGDIYKYYTGYYSTRSETTFTVGMKKGWNLRIINLLTGSEYTIEEVNIDEKFDFDKIIFVERGNNDSEHPYEPNINGKIVKGTIEKPNVSYAYTYNNKNVYTEVKVTKVWYDGDNKDKTRPQNITLRLFQGDTEYRSHSVTSNSDGNWEYIFKSLPIYDSNSNKYVYTVKEDTVDGYKTLEIVGSEKEGFIVTNVQLVSVTVKKVWSDAENQDGKRPLSLTVTLSNGDTVTLTKDNDWTGTINNLPMYSNGEEIEYSWTEGEMPEGYSLTDTKVNGYVTTLTNSYTPKTIDIVITKIWDDSDNKYELRPESINVTLYANEEFVQTITIVDGTNGWTKTIESLPMYSDGKEIIYTISEDIPDQYVAILSGNQTDGFIIQNILASGGGEIPDNPQTGDNIIIYLISLLISIIGLIFGKKYIKLYK